MGDNIQMPDYDGRTPLHCAAESGSVALVKLLLENDADVFSRCGYGAKTAFDHAASRGKDEVCGMLFELMRASPEVSIFCHLQQQNESMLQTAIRLKLWSAAHYLIEIRF
jgi:hypothetical protein